MLAKLRYHSGMHILTSTTCINSVLLLSIILYKPVDIFLETIPTLSIVFICRAADILSISMQTIVRLGGL